MKSIILTSPLKVMVPIIKVVGNYCNLRCDYCFYNSKNQSVVSVMSDKLLEKFIDQYMNLFSGNLIFVWHGGEPLLASMNFFEKVVDIQVRNLNGGQKIQNLIQTNATLIDEGWARFFKKNNFRVGVSLDGDKENHNYFRKNNCGRGSFDQAMQGIRILRESGINPGIIQTLTAKNLPHSKKIFKFFTEILCVKGWGTNIYLDMNNDNLTMVDQSLSNEQLSNFLISQIDLWLERNDKDLDIREIENFISPNTGKKSGSCAFNGACTGYFCINYDGKIYPCDRSSNSREWLLGDISKQSLAKILNGEARLRYAESVNKVHSDCVGCEWNKSCNNGCSMHRVGGVDGKYYFCETRKKVFTYLKEKIKKSKTSR